VVLGIGHALTLAFDEAEVKVEVSRQIAIDLRGL